MTGDLQLFMLWNNGRRLEKQILADIGSRYEIAGICEVFWPPRHFARNLARFYGKNLRKGAKKIRECGTGPFLVIVVRDPAPQYYDGKNINMSDSKYQYRKLFGGGYMVHASDNQTEAFENFLLLSGQDIAEFAANAPATAQTIGDITGAVFWKGEDEIRTILNKIPGCRLDSSDRVWILQTPNPNFAGRLLNAKKMLVRQKPLPVENRRQKTKNQNNPFFLGWEFSSVPTSSSGDEKKIRKIGPRYIHRFITPKTTDSEPNKYSR